LNVRLDPNIRGIRGGLGLTREGFAELFGLSASALADWEQGRRSPDKAARVLLTVIAHNHQAVLAALAAAKRRAGD
jgi:putative transcriptional regulator